MGIHSNHKLRNLPLAYIAFITFLAGSGMSLPVHAQSVSDSLSYWQRLRDSTSQLLKTDASEALSTATGSFFKSTVNEKNERVIVITPEQIIRGNYITLTDVLNDIAGFFVSQPGNFLLGETFHADGLNGNENFIIMVNGIVLRNDFSNGIAIGATLPVQQAQRIEIIRGPQSAVYGNHAAAGVINIITPQSERPVYIKASIGGNFSQNNYVSLIMGGKYGDGKNTIRFDMFGNFLDRGAMKYTTNKMFENALYETARYRTNTPAEYDPLASSSRMLGINTYYKSWHLMVLSSARKDQASLGLNPLSTNAAIANHYIAENNTGITLTHEKQRRKGGEVFTGFYYGKYYVDPSSSVRLTNPALKREALDLTWHLLAPIPNKDTLEAFYTRTSATIDNTDLGFERRRRMKIRELSVFLNFTTRFNFGSPLHTMGRDKGVKATPADTASRNLTLPVYLFQWVSAWGTGFEYSVKNSTFGALANVSVYNSFKPIASQSWPFHITGALKVYYKHILPRKSSILLNYASGYTLYSSYRFTNAVVIAPFHPEREAVTLERAFVNQSPLRNRELSISLLSRYYTDRTSALTVFVQQATCIPRTARYEGSQQWIDSAGSMPFYYGSFAPKSSQRNAVGVDYSFIIPIAINIENYPKHAFELRLNGCHTLSQTSTGYDFKTMSKRAVQPDNAFIASLYYSYNKNLEVRLQYRMLGAFYAEGMYDSKASGTGCFDLISSFRFTRNFTVNLRLYNMFKATLYGASATGSRDDLILNPMKSEFFIIKLNYALD